MMAVSTRLITVIVNFRNFHPRQATDLRRPFPKSQRNLSNVPGS